MAKSKLLVFVLCLVAGIHSVSGQKKVKYNLPKLLRESRLDTTMHEQPVNVVDSTKKVAINVKGIVWLKDMTFTTGTIDVDLRGRDVFLKSFMGIAFHAKDKSAYDVVYFCPFRFDDGDTTRWYSVKYMGIPNFDYAKLRKEHPHVYENEATPSPKPADWFHATIKVSNDTISVFVNHNTKASLVVKKLPTLMSGRIGLWSNKNSLSSDFANLEIRKDP